MARPRGKHVEMVKRELLLRLRHGFYPPGSRFLSNRAVAQRFGVSYQTADRLLRELTAADLLERRPASGTYVPGQQFTYQGAELLFHPRARHAASFGNRLMQLIEGEFHREGIPVRRRWPTSKTPRLDRHWLPVMWECPSAVGACISGQCAGILINELPPAGVGSLFLDSVSVDDFGGGAMAADLLVERTGRACGFAVLAGPAADPRSQARVAGFRSRCPAVLVAAPSWFVEGGLAVAAAALQKGPRGIFCCNDRLAQAVILWCEKHTRPKPCIVGFDDAPVARQPGLTTIAIPWSDLTDAIVAAARRRMTDAAGGGTRTVLTPRPVIRWAGHSISPTARQ